MMGSHLYTLSEARRLQRLVNTVRAVNPTCKILIGLITPAKSYFNAHTVGAYANWSTVNTAISGGGETPITGVDARVTSYNTTLNDGADDILPQYFSADLLHPNQYAKQYVIAPDVRKVLDSVGF